MGCDHVVFTTEGIIKCRHCGQAVAVPFPIAVDDFSKIITDFIGVHKNCKEQQV